MNSKISVRKMISSRLKRLKSLHRFENQNSKINVRLQNTLRTRQGVWGAFMPLSVEPNLTETYRKLEGQIQFAFPKVIGHELHFYMNADNFEKSHHGILEPDHNNANRVFASELAGILVPGVAFDHKGNRLGRGRGFYDRFLKKCKAEKIGLCFDSQLLNQQLTTQAHDEQLDRLLTENLSLNFAKRTSL